MISSTLGVSAGFTVSYLSSASASDSTSNSFLSLSLSSLTLGFSISSFTLGFSSASSFYSSRISVYSSSVIGAF